jgi:hypothetical protein
MYDPVKEIGIACEKANCSLQTFVRAAYNEATTHPQVQGIPEMSSAKIQNTVDIECDAIEKGLDPSWWVTRKIKAMK